MEPSASAAHGEFHLDGNDQQRLVNSVGNLTVSDHGRVQVGDTYTIYNGESPIGNRCVADLRLTDPRLDKIRIENAGGGLLKDSYRWIFDQADFQLWRDDPQSRLLWVNGDAGKGKTMMLCGIINELESMANTDHASYFFCQGTNDELNNATAVLRGLVFLLVDQQPCLLLHLETKYHHSGKRLFEDGNAFYALCDILRDILQDPRLGVAYLVVDALDECEEGLSELLAVIKETISTTSGRCKWIVSSRNRPDIERHLAPDESHMRLSLELNAEHVSQAINVYIEYKISQLMPIEHDEAIREQVRDHMRRKADGTFLWVALAMKQLHEIVLSRDVLPLLEKLSPGLEPLYDKMMANVEQHGDACRRVLSIVAVVHRPLSMVELRLLTGLQGVSQMSDFEKIIHLCGSFITIRQDQVYLIHQSAKEYLVTNASIFPRGHKPLHYDLFLRSMHALSRTLKKNMYNLDRPGLLISEMYPPEPDPLRVVRYSSVYWVSHLLNAADHVSDLAMEEINKFTKTHFLHWLESLSLLHKFSDGIVSIRSLLFAVQSARNTFTDRKKTAPKRFPFSTKRSAHTTSVLKRDANDEVVDFLVEADRFARRFGWVIEHAPLQTYAAALVFCPTSSKIKEHYWQEKYASVRNVVAFQESWGSGIQTLLGHRWLVNAVSFSPNGRTLASASDDATVRLWDAVIGKETYVLAGHVGGVNAIAFAPDAKTLASASTDTTVRLWDTATGTERQIILKHDAKVNAVVFSPDGETIATASNDETVRLWDAATGKQRDTVLRHSCSVMAVALSPDGSTLASASFKDLRLWDVSTGRTRHTLKGHKISANGIAFSPDGRTLASTSWYETVRLWNVATGKEVRSLKGSNLMVNDIAFSPDGRTLATASWDKTVRLWDVNTGKETQILKGHTDPVKSIAFSPDGSTLASAAYDLTVRLWDANMRKTLLHDGSSVDVVSVSPNGRAIASASGDRTVRIWDAATGKERHILARHTQPVDAIAFSPDGNMVASATCESVALWDTATGKRRWVIKGSSSAVAFSPDGTTLAFASRDGTVRLQDAITGGKKKKLLGLSLPITSIVFSPDSKSIAAALGGRAIGLWNTDTGHETQTLLGLKSSVNAVVFSPDSKVIVSVSDGGTLRLWDATTSKETQAIETGRRTDSIAFAGNGQTLRTAWGLVQLQPGTGSSAHPNDASVCARFINEGWLITQGEQDATVWLPPEYRRATCSAVSQDLVVLGYESGRIMFVNFSSR